VGLASLLVASVALGGCNPEAETTTISKTTTKTETVNQTIENTVTQTTTETQVSTQTVENTVTQTETVTETSTLMVYSVTDDRGYTYEFSEPVDSIISLAPSNTEIVYFVGAGDKLIGRTDFCNFPAEVSDVESIGGFSTPDKERVVILDPDIVLATGMHVSTGDVEWLEEQGLNVLVLEPDDIDGILDDILMVGQVTGNADTTATKVAELEARIDAVKAATVGLLPAERPSVLHVTWHDPLWTAGPDTFIGAVISMAGGTSLFNDISGDAQVDTEQAVTRNPQVITVVTSHGDYGLDSYNYVVAEDSPFVNTDAYINDMVMQIDGDLASRPGPRIVDALELIAQFLHPELFP
jgi:iron complex transport system substrate-binding protein